jgi:hypothetical protein
MAITEGKEAIIPEGKVASITEGREVATIASRAEVLIDSKEGALMFRTAVNLKAIQETAKVVLD